MAVTHAPGVLTGDGAIDDETAAGLRRAFLANPKHVLARNAVTRVSIDEVALNYDIATSIDHTFSHRIDDWTVTAQKASGRCWMFAGLNLLRFGAKRAMGLKEFEFSQNYTFFWDKFERANYFLEAIIETTDRDLDDRTVAFLLNRPVGDGGQWNMFVNLVEKHGLAPKAFMPETESSSNSRRLNTILTGKLREGAQALRDAHAGGATLPELRAAKDEILAASYRILAIHHGTPPERFVWEWTDKDGQFHRDPEMTPREFAAKYITIPLDEYVCLVNDPRPTSPYGRTYTVEYLGNVVGGATVKYLNVDIELMKEIALRTVMEGEPVWFGCDTGKMLRRDLGIWDKDLFDYQAVYDTTFTLGKANRLLYHETAMNHAMVFTGVDVVDGKPRRWRVENSWGPDNADKGFYTMNDSWFNEHMFEIAARKSYLPPELQRALDLEPIVLPAWDPLGALAR
ncbi:MAG TPA: C1 family peptidase [Thermomicrobiales bacterium]|nr:C1 family peptidase [Thermomicrobiales bacterium]